ncbi:MAG: nitrate reductase subunit beta, partial [Gammaproteobacteria bacterium]|nr:nitrate reductase subunit beta [Gammaproteobacteria bacterium]
NDDMLIALLKNHLSGKWRWTGKLLFPMHPEFRTLPMVWYVPPLSPVQSKIDQGVLPTGPDGAIPVAGAMRLPVQYLANLLTAGEAGLIESSLNRLIAMRSYMRSVNVEGVADTTVLMPLA